MRLSATQRQEILSIVRRHAGSDADVLLYGSRTRDEARGGDVDLIVHHARPLDPLEQARVQHLLEEALELPVDVSFAPAGGATTPFQRMVSAQAENLDPSHEFAS
jgi:predicted nucleotidyltransferase